MGEPQTLVREEWAFNEQAWAAVEIHRPGVALIDAGPLAGVLLTRDMCVERDGTLMRAVRWVRFPQGWRLGLLRMLAAVTTVCLPDEWLFNEVFLTLASNGMFIARLNRDARRPWVLPTPSEQPYATRALSASQYRLLAEAPGRLLHAQLRAMFTEQLGAAREMSIVPANVAWPVRPSPWRVFAGE